MSEPATIPAGRGGPQLIPRPDDAQPGPDAWWSQPDAQPPAAVTLADVRAAFAGRIPTAGVARRTQRVELPSLDPRPAAVLCALFEEDGQAAVILTRRSLRLRSHTGEVSFPGGRLEPGEDPLAAARRETFEEIGLDPAGVEVIGQLSRLATVSSRSIITPFVGVLAGPPVLRPDPAEVERAFAIPLVELMEPGAYHTEVWLREGDPVVHFFDLPGDTVWGATARILRELLDLVVSEPR